MHNLLVNILVVEDNPGDLLLVKEYLNEGLPNASVFHANNLAEAFGLIENNSIDIILLDLSLPDSNGIDTFHLINLRASQIPVIVLTGIGDTNRALETVKFGAQDYIVKDDANALLLTKSIHYSIERNKVYEEMKRSEEQYKYLFQNNPLPMLAYDKITQQFLMVNEAAVRHYGYSEQEFLQMTMKDIEAGNHTLEINDSDNLQPGIKNKTREITHRKKNDKVIDVEVVSHDILIEGRKAVLAVVQDVTATNKARKQLKESERMLRTISENFPNGAVAILNKDLRYEYTAGKEFHVPDVAQDYFKKTLYTSHFPEGIKEKVHENLMKVFKGESVVFEAGYNNATYMISAVPLISGNKQINKIVLASQNISKQKEALKQVHFQSNILEQLSNFVIFVNNQFNITYYNKAAEETFGTRLRQLSANKLSHLFLPACVEAVEHALKQAADNNTNEAELKCLDVSDKEIWVSGTFSKMYDEDNNAVGILCLGKDISAEKEKEQQLLLFESVITNTNDAVVITKANHRDNKSPTIVYVNAAFTKMTGYTQDEVVGKTAAFLQGPGTDKKEVERLHEARVSWQPCEVELLNYKKDGSKYWSNFTIVPVSNSKRKYSHWISVQRDVTMRKESETEKEMLIDELIHSNTDLRQFSYITSHNLRSPLSNLLGIIKLIDMSSITDPMNALLIQNFKQSTIQLNDTVNDLINVLIIKNNVNAKKEELDISTTFQKVRRSIERMMDEQEVEVQTDFSAADHIEFNHSYLESILLNLLTNAIKYKSPERQLIIQVYTKIVNDQVKLYFADNGLGIDLERHGDRLFGLYQRFHDHADSKGLGLYIVNSQVRAMGGTIEAKSKVNKGTTFIITFKKTSAND